MLKVLYHRAELLSLVVSDFTRRHGDQNRLVSIVWVDASLIIAMYYGVLRCRNS